MSWQSAPESAPITASRMAAFNLPASAADAKPAWFHAQSELFSRRSARPYSPVGDPAEVDEAAPRAAGKVQ